MSEDRERVVRYLRDQLIGPANGPEEELVDRPDRRYAMGTLYPRAAAAEALLSDEPADEAVGSVDDELPDDPILALNSWMPSSCGLSLFLQGEPPLKVEVHGAVYDAVRPKDAPDDTAARGRRGRRWIRRAVASDDAPDAVLLSPDETTAPVLEGRGRVKTLWRNLGDGWLVTVSLLNEAQVGSETDLAAEDCLYQVGFRCSAPRGSIGEYPSVEHLTEDEEEEELRVAYRGSRVFAVGHNCSVDWPRTSGPNGPDHVRTEFLPGVDVPPVTADAEHPLDALRLSWLAEEGRSAEDLRAALHAFVEGYAAWIEDQAREEVPVHLEAARRRIVGRQRHALRRMRAGVDALADPQVAEAFRLANLAMLVQMRHSKDDLGGRGRPRRDGPLPELDYLAEPYAWRPFQLAFQLLALPSLADHNHPARDVVDLLWFPTGGGKTEAYLGLAAFTIILRRLRLGPDGGGTTVITRYTLRLLTTQQFQRTATLVCSLERLRRADARLGDEPIRLGLWLGQGVTPNKLGGDEGATRLVRAVKDAAQPKSVYPFQLDRCPWCGTEIVPDRQVDDDSVYGIWAANDDMGFRCPSPGCEFSGGLPIDVVDEVMYERPPTFLISTVDKFARLAWEEKAGRLLSGGGVAHPPEMIIQDELHLLSGPLGTTVGVYEAAVETVIRANGPPPKIVSSTATIRRAGDQIEGLYGREAEVFPPSGVDASDSFFARVDRRRPGRLYVGVMTPAHTTAMAVRLAVAPLLAAPLELELSDRVSSAYWTVVVYHNSLRELGRTMTIARDDVPAHLELIASQASRVRRLGDEDVVELTSNVPASELPTILRRMNRGRGEPDAISVLACTNMLSVGIDVPRLAVMVVNGQPKTTSEYIQATSRVGRGDVPGLVVALLSATKPRDRSHYEGFLAFHQALYRHVEPTSVTPYSLPSRDRALHAALVIAVRHGAGLHENADAQRFRADDARVARIIGLLATRAADGDAAEAEATRLQLEELAAEWSARAEAAKNHGPPLVYSNPGKAFQSLLVDFQSGREGWETLHSMRSVDLQVGIDV